MTSTRSSWITGVFQENRFILLFVSLLIFMVASPLVKILHDSKTVFWGNAIMAILYMVFMLAAVFAVSKSRLSIIVGVSFAVPVAVLQTLQLFIEQDTTIIFFHLLAIIYLSYVIVLVIGYIFEQQKVDANKIFASLCVYLMLGVVWALLYSLLELLQPGTFSASFADAATHQEMRFGQGQSVVPLYYSLVTMTTLGYGDVIPLTNIARMFAALEAIIGQLYIAVLVARLVAVYTTSSKEKYK